MVDPNALCLVECVWFPILGAMLEQVLAPEQYAPNVTTKNGGERVEFAIKLPGRGDDDGEIVWLPIDAKFPIEDYHRLVRSPWSVVRSQ